MKASANLCSNIKGIACANIAKGAANLAANLTSALERTPASDVISLSKGFPINIGEHSKEVTLEFNKLVSILKSRNPKQIEDQAHYAKILKQIFKNPNYSSEKELLAYIKRLAALSGKKSPDGDFLLNGTTIHYLADYKENGLSTKQLRQFADLIRCGEKGLVPPTALQNFKSADGVNPEMLRDIEKLKFASANGLDPIDVFIPQFKSIVKNADDISKLQPGDMYSIKNPCTDEEEVFLVMGKNMVSLLSLDRESLFKLMPPVKRFFIGQHGSGTCYQLASYISMMNSPKFMGNMLSRIRELNDSFIIKMPDNSTPNNLFAGKFKDFSSAGCVRTNMVNGRFIPEDPTQSALSNPLLKAMENLYGKHRKYTFADEYVRFVRKTGGDVRLAYAEALKNMDKCVYVKDDKGNFTVKTLGQISAEEGRTFMTVEDYYKPSGKVDEMFKFFNKGFNKISTFASRGKSDTETLDQLRKLLEIPNAAKTFGTIPKKDGMESLLDKRKDLYSSHAYSIVSYCPDTGIVTYINPWNSALTHELKLEELAKYIGSISVCQ